MKLNSKKIYYKLIDIISLSLVPLILYPLIIWIKDTLAISNTLTDVLKDRRASCRERV